MDYRVTATTPVYDLVLTVLKRRMRYLGHVLRLPPDRILRRSLIALVKGGTYYPEGSLFSDCELESLEELLDIATNRHGDGGINGLRKQQLKAEEDLCVYEVAT